MGIFPLYHLPSFLGWITIWFNLPLNWWSWSVEEFPLGCHTYSIRPFLHQDWNTTERNLKRTKSTSIQKDLKAGVYQKTKSISNQFLLLVCFGSIISKTCPKKLDHTDENWATAVTSVKAFFGRHKCFSKRVMARMCEIVLP